MKYLQKYGVRGNMLHFMRNFLVNRQVTVCINNTHASIKDVREETPHGSTLSCTLFLIAINEISSSLANGVYRTLHMDDYAIYATGKRLLLLERKLQSTINRLNEWANAN